MLRIPSPPALLVALSFSLAASLSAQLRFDPPWRELGPANMSGRIVDLVVDKDNRNTWFVATASGGLFRTTNAGTTWKPLFQHQATISIGAVALGHGDPKTLWVGTGEANPRNSVSWGDGVYVSRDAGETWTRAGLKESFQIGCIAVHPVRPDTVFVAACGKLWSESPERGLYRTTDGGKRWEHVLQVDAKTGAIDVVIDEQDPDVMFAATYERQRDAFDTGDPAKRWGPGSGLWKSTDGGSRWRRLRDGLPTTAIGRIGIAIAPSDAKTVYAVIETERSGWATGEQETVQDADGKPKRGYGTRLGGQIANVQLEQGPNGFQTGGVFRSKDGGETWTRVNSLAPRPFYFSQIRVDPTDAARIYVLGIQYYVSRDGGELFEQVRDHGIHVDFHAMWIDPTEPRHWLLGSDGGLYETFDRGANFRFFKNLPCAQFYHVSVDDLEPYRVYGGLQDNGSWTAPSRTRFQDGVRVGDVFKFGMGDGFRVLPDPERKGLVYFTSQFGRMAWYDLASGNHGGIKYPRPPHGAKFRFNWNTPFALSPHDPAELWFAGNFVMRATERGQKSEILSPEISRGDRGTATALALSPKNRGLVWVGTDDGALSVSRNAGKDWKDLTKSLPGLPGPRCISCLHASAHRGSTVYLSFDGHRSDDMAAYAYVSRNAGSSWSRISRGIERGPVRVIHESPDNPDLLFAGTEFGIWASLDRGKHWFDLRGNLPTVPVHDIAYQAREKELVIATHGRGAWILDVAGLTDCTARIRGKSVALIEPRPVRRRRLLPARIHVGDDTREFANPAEHAAIHYWLKRKSRSPVTIEILEGEGRGRELDELPVLRQFVGGNDEGLHRIEWNLRRETKRRNRGRPSPVSPGTFTIRLTSGKTALTQKLEVLAN